MRTELVEKLEDIGLEASLGVAATMGVGAANVIFDAVESAFGTLKGLVTGEKQRIDSAE